MLDMEKLKQKLEEAKKVKTSQEIKKKAEQEAKPLGTAVQQLLPEIFEEERAIPNYFLRRASFGMVRKGNRPNV